MNEKGKSLLISAFPGLSATQAAEELIYAAYWGKLDKVKALIDAGVDVNQADENGYTPLYWAVWGEGGYTDVAKALIDAGADVNQADEDGFTPLHTAVSFDYTDIAKALIDLGADVNKANKDGITPLYDAVEDGYLEIVEMLVEAGADLHSVDSNGKTLQQVAAENNHPNVLEYLKLVGGNWDIGKQGFHISKLPKFLQDRYLATYWSLQKSELSDKKSELPDDVIREIMAKIKL